MMQLSSFLVIMIGLFALIGYMRGWTKELIASAGIILALFTLDQFETIFIDPLTNGQQGSKFWLQAVTLLAFAFFAYQTPPESFARGGRVRSNREGFQDGILGALVGAWNGYLLFGSLWWYLDSLEYPLSPYIIPVDPGSASANWVNILPLSWMLSGDGGVLTFLMIGLFIFIIVTVV